MPDNQDPKRPSPQGSSSPASSGVSRPGVSPDNNLAYPGPRDNKPSEPPARSGEVPSLDEILAASRREEEETSRQETPEAGTSGFSAQSAAPSQDTPRAPRSKTREQESLRAEEPTPSSQGPGSQLSDFLDNSVFPMSFDTIARLPILIVSLLLVTLYMFYRSWFWAAIWLLIIAILIGAIAAAIGRLGLARFRDQPGWNMIALVYGLIWFTLFAGIGYWAIFTSANVNLRAETNAEDQVQEDSQLKVVTDKPHWFGQVQNIQFDPPIPGQWQPVRKIALIPISNEFVFVPEQPLSNDQTYVLSTEGFNDLFGQAAVPDSLEFHTIPGSPGSESSDQNGAPDQNPEREPLSVESVTPAQNSNDVATSVQLELTFNLPVDPESMSYEISPQTSHTIEWQDDDTRLVVVPAQGWEPDTQYRLRLLSARSKDEEALNQPHTVLFRTAAEADSTPDAEPEEPAEEPDQPAEETPQEPAEETETPPEQEEQPEETPTKGGNSEEDTSEPPAEEPAQETPTEEQPAQPTDQDESSSEEPEAYAWPSDLERNQALQKALTNELNERRAAKGMSKLLSTQAADNVASIYTVDVAYHGLRSNHVDSQGRTAKQRLVASGIDTDNFVEAVYLYDELNPTAVINAWLAGNPQLATATWSGYGLAVTQNAKGEKVAVLVVHAPEE